MKFYNDGTTFLVERHVGNTIENDKHFHSVYEFYYLEEGNISYFIGDKVYKIKKGDVVIIPPNTIHNTLASEKQHKNRKRILFYLSPIFLNGLLEDQEILWDYGAVFSTENNEKVSGIFKALLDEFVGMKDASLMKAFVYELIVYLQRLEKSNPEVMHTDTLETKVSEIINYMIREYTTSLTLEKIADVFYMNPS